MFAKGRRKSTIRFSVTPDKDVRKVAVAGDFNDWQPVVMRKNAGGEYVAVVSASAGPHEYKFIFGERWVVDPDNDIWAASASGTINSVAVVTQSSVRR